MCLLSPAAQAASTAPTILVTGDSLSAAYGIPLEQGWVALLQKRLEQKGYPYTVVNTSVSGETTAGGLGRLGKELQQYKPDLVVIELGANDGLRGLSLKQMHKNLQAMIEQSRAADAEVLLLGMRLPSNYGQAYTEQFHQTFKDVAEQTKVPLVPFLLEDIALNRSMFQEDGVHPTAAAQPALLEHVWTKLEEMLQPTAQVAQE